MQLLKYIFLLALPLTSAKCKCVSNCLPLYCPLEKEFRLTGWFQDATGRLLALRADLERIQFDCCWKTNSQRAHCQVMLPGHRPRQWQMSRHCAQLVRQHSVGRIPDRLQLPAHRNLRSDQRDSRLPTLSPVRPRQLSSLYCQCNQRAACRGWNQVCKRLQHQTGEQEHRPRYCLSVCTASR